MSLLGLFFFNCFFYFFTQFFVGMISNLSETVFSLKSFGLLLFFQAGIFAVYLFCIYRKKLKANSLNVQSFFRLFFYSVFLIFLVNILGMGLEWIGGKMEESSVVALIKNSTGINLVGIILVAVLFVPFIEEVLFRGFLFQAMLDKGFRVFAYCLSAFLFAFAHLSLILFPIYFLLGCSLAYIYEKEKSVWACTFVHCLFNGLSVTFLLCLGN